MRRRSARLIALCCSSVLIGGCSGVTSLTSLSQPVVTAANAFSPVGYSQTRIDDTHFQVQASGTDATPTARVEKIARARAAEIGVEQKLKFFKVASVERGIICSKRQEGYKSTATPASAHPSVVLDVCYAQDAADPAYQNSADVLASLKTDLAAEEIAPRGPRGRHSGDARGLHEGMSAPGANPLLP